VGLVFLSVAAACGASIALLFDLSPRVLLVAAPPVVVAAFLLANNHARTLAAGLLSLTIGCYAGARAGEPPVVGWEIADVVDTDRRIVAEGRVLSAPEATGDGSRLRFALLKIDGVPTHATVALAVASGSPDVWPGDAIRFVTRLRSVRGLANPGVADSALAARASGIDLFAGVGAATAITLVDADSGTQISTVAVRWAARVRRALGRAIDASVGGAAGVFLHTAVLGERRGNDPNVEDGFRAAGATHVLSVSGLHLAAIALVFFAGARMLLSAVPRLPLWIQPRAAAALIALPAITFYTLVTGSAIATVRSALMMGVALVGVALGRRGTPLIAIAMTVVVLLGWSPLVLVDVSFQLSVVSVLALSIVVPRFAVERRGKKSKADAADGWASHLPGVVAQVGPRVWRWLARLGAAALAAGLTTAPLVAHHFGELTPAAPLGNLFLVPLVELVVVPFALGGAVIGALLGQLWSWPFLKIAEIAARIALGGAEIFRVHAPVWLTRSPNAFETAGLSVGFACVLALLHGPGCRRTRIAAVGGVLVVVAAGSMVVREIVRRSDPNLMVTFLDIGQGDSAVIQTPGGHMVLVDGGGTYDGAFDPGARVVEPFLRARGITRLDAVALSHPHPDHMGGLHRILARFPVARLWTSGDNGRNPDYDLLLGEARAHEVPTPVPVRWTLAETVVDPLGPFVTDGPASSGEHIGPPEGTTVNDASLVLRIGFSGRSVLFTGDVEANGEGELAGRTSVGQTVASDVLKVPHHGSRTSSSDDLLDSVRPRLAIMSLGWRNRFHFPRAEVVERYRARGIRLLRTDLNGAVTVTIAPDGAMTTTCARGCP
jgi:competence protein ComEC